VVYQGTNQGGREVKGRGGGKGGFTCPGVPMRNDGVLIVKQGTKGVRF